VLDFIFKPIRMAEKDCFKTVTQIVDSPVVVALVIVLKGEKAFDENKVTIGGSFENIKDFFVF
jgi:hypothetical protein